MAGTLNIMKQKEVTLLICLLGFLVKGCATSERLANPGQEHDQSVVSAGYANVPSEIGDSVHQGSTGQAERDSVKKKMFIVAAIVLAAMFLFLFVAISKKGA